MTPDPISNPRTVAVLGGGSGGHAMVFYLAALGCDVRWWVADPEAAAQIGARGEVTAIGAFTGTASVARVSAEIESIVRGVDLIFVVLPSNAHPSVAAAIAPHLSGRETLVLCPGRTGGAVCFRRSLSDVGEFPDVVIAETQSLIFTCRRVEPGFVDFMKFKDFGQMATLGELSEEVADFLAAAFPQVLMEASTLVTGLANYGAMLHPAPVLLNVGRIEDPQAPFVSFYNGITPTIARFIERMDEERIALAALFGIDSASTLEWHELCYGVGGADLFEALRVNERYASLQAPRDLGHRYIHEDIPTGLIPMITLADAVGHPVPCMKAVLDLAGLVLGEAVRSGGRDAEAMGLAGRTTIEQIQALFAGSGGS